MEHNKKSTFPKDGDEFVSYGLNLWSKSQCLVINPASHLLKFNRQSVVRQASITLVEVDNFVLAEERQNLQVESTLRNATNLEKNRIRLA